MRDGHGNACDGLLGSAAAAERRQRRRLRSQLDVQRERWYTGVSCSCTYKTRLDSLFLSPERALSHVTCRQQSWPAQGSCCPGRAAARPDGQRRPLQGEQCGWVGLPPSLPLALQLLPPPGAARPRSLLWPMLRPFTTLLQDMPAPLGAAADVAANVAHRAAADVRGTLHEASAALRGSRGRGVTTGERYCWPYLRGRRFCSGLAVAPVAMGPGAPARSSRGGGG